MTTKTIKVHGKEYKATFRKEGSGYSYSIAGPITKLEGFTVGTLQDTVKEAIAHASEKFPR